MFPPEVKEPALIACGRFCCLCHKYCGIKMECHHVVPASEGGKDSFENCIPLCFDCHADAGHYNVSHPKGTKFSPTELIAHRDRWYLQVSTGVRPELPADHLALDRALFARVVSILGGSARMAAHYRDHDYGASFPKVIQIRLREFHHNAGLPAFEFFNSPTETSFAGLKSSIEAYLRETTGKVYYEGDSAQIPPEWLEENRWGKTQEDRFEAARVAMNEVASLIWKTYFEFVQTARAALGSEEPSREQVRAYLEQANLL